MNPFAALFGGLLTGAALAVLFPEETREVMDAIEEAKIDRALFALAAGTLPAGGGRDAVRKLGS